MDSNIDDTSNIGDDYRYTDNETFLKKKLIETHNKLIKELEINKQLEDKLLKAMRKDNQTRLVSNLESPTKRQIQEKQKQIQELSNKNELMRIDLQSMRKRILNQIMQKNHFQQLLKVADSKSKDTEQEYKKCYLEIKKRQAEYVTLESNYNALYQKYEISLENAKKLMKSLQDQKKVQSTLNMRILDLENLIKQEREKAIIATNDYKNLHKQYRQCKTRMDSQEEVIRDLKNKLYLIQTKSRTDKSQQGSNFALEKLTQQMNFMATMYKQKEKKLNSENVTQKSQKRLNSSNNQNFNNELKQLVQKLEEEQRQKLSERSNINKDTKNVTFSPSPNRRREIQSPSKNQKQDASILQNTIFQCNITKNKILNDIDKIDMTKVKTNQLLTKRRKLEQDLAKIEILAEQSRKKLKYFQSNSSSLAS